MSLGPEVFPSTLVRTEGGIRLRGLEGVVSTCLRQKSSGLLERELCEYVEELWGVQSWVTQDWYTKRPVSI